MALDRLPSPYPRSERIEAGQFAVRTGLCVFGVVAMSWSLSVLGPLTSASSLDRISGRILQIEAFQLPLLKSLAHRAGRGAARSLPRPETLREVAIVNERLLEQDIFEGKRREIDAQMAITDKAVLQSLASGPADPFLWLLLYWLRTAQGGISQANMPFLRMSYQTGPNEGWVALKRNRFAFIAAPFLPPDLVEYTLREFVTMVSSGFIDDTADILVGPAWAYRDTILARIEDLPLPIKHRFARRLYDLGYDVRVPGVAPFNDRPWR